MKIVVAGASGLIGTQLAADLRRSGHDVAAASLSLGIDTVTGKGLEAAMTGAEVVVDVTNAASFGDNSAFDFFKASTKNLLAAAAEARVRHYLALSVVGTPRLVESDYFRAKAVQENLIRASARPYTILRSTQFYEFINGVIDIGAEGNVVRLPPASARPVAAHEVAALLAELATGDPLGNIIEIGGPEQFGIDEIARIYLAANEDQRQVIADPSTSYFGVELTGDVLLPHVGARVATQKLSEWLYRSMAA
ncbi:MULTISPECIES: SDR family oxidoreductase [Rhizobium]|uniref:SDR family oxidoreductase n=1 Tax=Rhizobium TaxID=379 RepID=UPI0007EBF49A|nr:MULTISPECIES: NAD(P)H-binding protein [Rhizobium]ANK95187.1 NAD(P)-binding domain-containing protein [Rhizobium sp. N6212]ANL01238.1 NAD(P)-binding domain-containing protein [Rhizobium sp. N621]ANL07361.1 NAD(P)-binding domain-containing protein [Rhizobium esperanzae]ANL13531.1 NAD(P)-binding domain-containing protein [Rhizobium sp. N1341]ANL25517.1 NAD(P)-binding domain-containing protein [Rhizobium sp. N113]